MCVYVLFCTCDYVMLMSLFASSTHSLTIMFYLCIISLSLSSLLPHPSLFLYIRYHDGIAKVKKKALMKKESEEKASNEKQSGSHSSKHDHASTSSSASSTSSLPATTISAISSSDNSEKTISDRNVDFVAMRSSLFDWLKAPVSLNKGEDLSEKKVLRSEV